MSALLAHAKAYRALADALMAEWDGVREDNPARPVLFHLSLAHHGAANRLEEQARAEASPPETCAGCGAESPAPGKRCAACGRLKA